MKIQPPLLITLGLLESIFSLLLLSLVYKLSGIYSEFEISPYNIPVSYALFGTLLIIGIIQIVRGLKFLKSKDKERIVSSWGKNSNLLIIAGVIYLLVMAPMVIILLIQPIYQLTNSF